MAYVHPAAGAKAGNRAHRSTRADGAAQSRVRFYHVPLDARIRHSSYRTDGERLCTPLRLHVLLFRTAALRLGFRIHVGFPCGGTSCYGDGPATWHRHTHARTHAAECPARPRDAPAGAWHHARSEPVFAQCRIVALGVVALGVARTL